MAKLQQMHTERDCKSIVVAVPGVRTSPPGDWGVSSTWLEELPEDVISKPAIFSYNHNLSSDDAATWTDLLDQGAELVGCLLTLQKNEALRALPIVFVSHSVGGLIVKKALCLIFQQIAYLRPLPQAIAASIFLGTPHSRNEKDKVWAYANLLLRPRSRYRRLQGIEPQDARRLAELCVEFDEAAANLPMVSVVETREATIKGITGMAFKNTKALIVEEQSAVVKAKHEVILQLALNHFELCSIDNAVFASIEQFLRPAVTSARNRLREQAADCAPLGDLDASTIAGKHSPISPSDGGSGDDKFDSNKPTINTSDPPGERAAKAVDFSTYRRDPRLPCHLIPHERNRDFFNRTELMDQLHEHLCPSHGDDSSDQKMQTLRSYAICGPGGIGKTQAAAEFALSHVDSFDAIIWVHADGVTKLAADYNRTAVELGLVLEASLDAKDLAVTRELVKGWLSNPVRSFKHPDRMPNDSASWLLVFDNVNNREDLADFWPVDGSVGSVLITSRDPLAKTEHYGIQKGTQLQPFSANDSAKVLLRLTWREDDEAERATVPDVAHKLGGYPLALAQMAGVIVRQDISFDEFSTRYDEEHSHRSLFQTNIDSKPGVSVYPHTLASVFLFQNLTEGMALLEVLSMLDPDEISEIIFEPALAEDRLSGYPNNATEYQQARSELLRSSLILRNRGTKTLSIHRLVQDTCCSRMSTERYVQVFQFAQQLLSRAWPDAGFAIRHSNKRWKTCAVLTPHILRLKDRFNKQSAEIQALLANDVRFAHVLNELGWYLQERVQTDIAVDCFQLAQANLKTIIAHSGGNVVHPNKSGLSASFLLAETYRNLGASAFDSADVQPAFDNFMVYHEMMLAELGDNPRPTDPRLAISYQELGVTRAFRHEYLECKACSEKAIELCEWIEQPDVVLNIKSLSSANLSLALLELGEDKEFAREVAAKALQARETALGVNDRVSIITGRLLHALGNINHALGHEEQSFEYHKRALQHFKETVGPNYHRVADMSFKVAQHHVWAGRTENACVLLDHATSIYRNQACYKAERARVYRWKAKLTEPGEAIVLERDARRLLTEAHSARGTQCTSFEDHDFDEFIVYWSR